MTVRSRKFWILLALILAGAAAVFFAGAQRVPLWDRDEGWYSECSREMMQCGDWVVPTYLKAWRLEKPPMIYWCEIISMSIAGDTAQAARFPSTLAVLLTVFLIALVVRRYTGDRRALWTVLIFSTSGVTVACAKMCLTDGVLLFFIITGQACLAMLYWSSRRGKKPPPWVVPVFWIALGLAGITKGPQPLGEHLFTLLILLTLDVLNEGKGLRNKNAWKKHIRWWGQLQPLVGVPILVAVVAPWLILIHHRAPGFLTPLFLKAGKHLGSSMDGHGEPPGYHALLIFGTFYPWSLLLPTTIALAWRNRRLTVIRFAIAAMTGPWLMMELVYTKLPFYVLPAFPALAFLTADTIIRCARGQYAELRKPSFYATIVIWIIATLGLSFGVWFAGKAAGPGEPPVAGLTVFTLAGVAYASMVAWRFFQQRIARAALIMGVGMAVMLLILYTAILPNLNFLHLPSRLAADMKSLGATGPGVNVQMIGYNEPTLAFYQGGGARTPAAQSFYFQLTPQKDWARWFVILDNPKHLLKTTDDWQDIPEQYKQTLRIRASETGLNYSHDGKMLTVLIVENIAAGK